MPVEPVPCAPDGGSTPGACNCSPSIATSPLCCADGSTVLLVVRSPCVTCGQAAAEPAVVGWIDPETGAFTAGQPACDVVPCDSPACIDTLCRTLCDDTTGDGQADATYSELWCIQADGTATLVLTYQDDPSVPYTPVSPVDCTYGCPEHETVMLCDDTGPFLRRYTFLAGTASFEDVALDGQTPHVVIGTVGVCPAAPDCASPTTPTATVGLCLADGTPIAVLLTRDCDGVTTQAGWVNLTTGTYSAGAPPAGAAACGDSRSFELAGILCDTDPATGEVLGLVLVQYEYNPDGSLAGVELVNPADGTPYVLQGELMHCPTGQDQPDPDLVILCDVQPDGTSTQFVRDYRRDENTQITGFTDYTLAGAAYTPTGTVGTCDPPPCGSTITVPLCDLQLDGTSRPFVRRLTFDCAGNVINSADTTDGTSPYSVTGTVGVCPPAPTPVIPQVFQGEFILCDDNGPFVHKLIQDDTGAVTAVVDLALDGTAYTPVGTVGQCPIDVPGPVPVTPTVFHGELLLCDDNGPFVRKLVQAPDGTVTAVANLALDGTPYTPVGTVGTCQPASEPCRNSSTLLLCDLPTDGEPAPTLTDTPGAPYYPYTTGVAATGVQALWDGGTLNLPAAAGPQPGTGGTVRTGAATLQAPRPVCDAGTAHVTAQVDVTQLGPDNGCRTTGFLALYNGTGEANRIALDLAPVDTPVGWSGTLAVEADVPAADLAAGNIAVTFAFDAYDDSGATCPPPRHTAWQLDQFAATVVYDQTGCATQFLRTVTTDCETGTVVTVTDTTLDGAPYTVTGEPGQCVPVGGGTVVEPCGDTEVAQLCDLTYDPQAPIPTPASDFTLTGNVVAANDGTTLWFAQANQPANGVATLTVSGLLPAVRYEFRFASAWIGAGNPDPANNNAIYLLEILDGATVLAARNRNVSNGSNVFPGGVLTEDLPPLAFIAPSTGAVTIRFTDQTTGGPINDRDLFLMPLEVRTEALTVKRTPFLRRYTFDCDGGLASTQDLGLDGTTPYAVQGDVATCAADGGTAGAATPCDVQNVIETCRCDDTDGDGIGDTDYVELLGVSCDGTLTSLGTYTEGLSAPYVPVAPVECPVDGAPEADCPTYLLQECRCDDSDGDGQADTDYVELLKVNGCTGALTSLGTYSPDMFAPYTPVSPVDCETSEDLGADPAFGVQAHRTELATGASWSADDWPTLQSVTAVAHDGTGVITTAEGASTLHPGEAATWSVGRDTDARLTGPLVIAADTGTVTITYTTGVQL
ncbi:hypothetical protein ABZ499_27610 [Streptomyces sp. NPDC019990]|uniref:hypothetical protein n=1 Tax=Streptomyces sp. NPDC019990 TaxID=3154693 RepID=UPI0033DCC40F